MTEKRHTKAAESKSDSAAGFPTKEPKSGHLNRHDRLLTQAEIRDRESADKARRKAEVDAQAKDASDRELKGWAARRRAR